MSQDQAIRILNDHSIAHKFINGALMIKDEYTLNGTYKYNWIECPCSISGIKAFLNY